MLLWSTAFYELRLVAVSARAVSVCCVMVKYFFLALDATAYRRSGKISQSKLKP